MAEGEPLDLGAPKPVRRIARRLEDAGFDTWAVGGAIRDRLIGRPTGDWDLTTRATPQEMMALFRRTVPVGVDHGTVGILEGGQMYEVTTFRRDVETFGRHAVVAFADTVEEDLSRRDFTINAIAWHPLTGVLVDPFGGQSDLESGVLRTVGAPDERFAEDYLRVLRALRFAGAFHLDIEPATWVALRAAVSHLPELSAERVREELIKVLAQAREASVPLNLYRDAGILEILYPELAPLPRERPAEGEPDLWTVSVRAVDSIPPHRSTLRLAALLHGIGMPPARTKDLRGGWRYTGHEVLGGRKAEDVMRRLKSSNADTDRVVRLVAHQSDLFPPDAPEAGVRRWLRQIGPDLVPDLFRLRFALWRGRHADEGGVPEDLLERWAKVRRVLHARPALAPADLAIGGADLKALGIAPGPRFGEILQSLLERVTDDPALNDPEALREIVRAEWINE